MSTNVSDKAAASIFRMEVSYILKIKKAGCKMLVRVYHRHNRKDHSLKRLECITNLFSVRLCRKMYDSVEVKME